MTQYSPWLYDVRHSTKHRLKTDLAPHLERPIPDDFNPDDISWVTGRLGITDWEGALEASLTGCYVINVAPELSHQKENDITLPVSGRDVRSELSRVANTIHNKLNESPDTKVVVHCAMGMERAPLSVIWYLYKYENMPLGTAHDKVVAARPIVLNCLGWLR
jgi:protein-tyrosine phosphatase